MNRKRVNKWAFISFVIGIIFSIISMVVIHTAYGDFFRQIHWLVTLVVAIPWVIFILCLLILLFAEKRQ